MLIAGMVVLAVALVVLARVNLDVEQVAQAVQDLASLDVKALVLAVLVLAHSVQNNLHKLYGNLFYDLFT